MVSRKIPQDRDNPRSNKYRHDPLWRSAGHNRTSDRSVPGAPSAVLQQHPFSDPGTSVTQVTQIEFGARDGGCKVTRAREPPEERSFSMRSGGERRAHRQVGCVGTRARSRQGRLETGRRRNQTKQEATQGPATMRCGVGAVRPVGPPLRRAGRRPVRGEGTGRPGGPRRDQTRRRRSRPGRH